MKKLLLIVLLIVGCNNSIEAETIETTNLFFSEYAEGSINNKYLEIYNATDGNIDLSNYSLSSCSNGCNDGENWDYPNNVTFEAGTIGDDPGSGWDVAGISNVTKDHTLVRKSSVVSGNNGSWGKSAGDAESSEWEVYDQNFWDYLGSH